MKPGSNDKTDMIFCATLKLVLETGVAGITMRQIAKGAGIATGTLYIYFKDKEKLINELFNKCRDAALNIYFTGHNGDDSFVAGFKKIWYNMLNHRIANFEQAVFLDQCFHSPFITESTKEMSTRVLQPLLKLIEKGKAEKIFKEEDTFLLLIFMIGSVHELIKYVQYSGRTLTDDMITAAYKICLDGLKR